MLKRLLRKHAYEFNLLCKTHKVKFMYAFGSSTKLHYSIESDIDLIVEVDEPDPLNRGELLLSLWNSLEKLFNKKIDLLTFEGIKNPFLDEVIGNTKTLIYDGSKEKIV